MHLPSSFSLEGEKINGVHLESPETEMEEDYVSPVRRVHANWVALVPYVFIDQKEGSLHYPSSENWWGDAGKGLLKSIHLAKTNRLKICLKPHYWLVEEESWAGELTFSEQKWLRWEKQYEAVMLQFARLADSLDIEMLCLGTELKSAVVERPAFWQKLIPKIRQVYQGKLIYAANWDNYQAVKFWKALDFIGINAYFPLVKAKTPQIRELQYAWNKHTFSLERFAEQQNRQVLFTEMGYRSTDFCAWRQWEIEQRSSNQKVNLLAQENAMEALFRSCWDKPWLAGGFLWEWHAHDTKAGGPMHSNYSPQHKPVEKTIAKWYQEK